MTRITRGQCRGCGPHPRFRRFAQQRSAQRPGLSKNAHWLFDNGLWALTDDYKVAVAVGRFAEDSSHQKGLLEYRGQTIDLPGDRALWPNPVHLAWHRKHRFQGT